MIWDLLKIGAGAALMFGGYRLARDGYIPSVMISKEQDGALYDAVTLEILKDLDGVLEDGDWIITRSYTLHGDLLDLIQPRSSASHIAMFDGVQGDVVEAVWPRIANQHLGSLVDESHSIVVIRPSNLSPKQLREAVEVSRAQIGKPFDLIGLVGLLRARDGYYCSDLIAQAFRVPVSGRVVRPTDLLDHGRVVYAAIRTNRALIDRAQKEIEG